jgi:hypothetical protein
MFPSFEVAMDELEKSLKEWEIKKYTTKENELKKRKSFDGKHENLKEEEEKVIVKTKAKV